MRRLAAVIAQAMSYATTLAAAHHVLRPGVLTMWLATIGLALLVEALFFGMKEAMFAPGLGNKGVGLLGFLFDGLVNTGGALVFASRILTFGPVALMLGVIEVDIASPDAMLAASVIASLLFGLTLSIAPHILWRGERKPRAAARAAA